MHMAVRPRPGGESGALSDEHSVLLWQACAYADELTAAARGDGSMTLPYLAMVDFVHQRLLPYLREEERNLPPTHLRDEHMAPLLRSDHARLRADAANIESTRTRQAVALAAEALVDHLDRHVRREETWMRPGSDGSSWI
jgi:hypothetical protein